MTATAVDHRKALEALGRADWMIGQAYVLLVPVLHAALNVKGAEPDALAEALLASIREVQALAERFTAAQGRDP